MYGLGDNTQDRLTAYQRALHDMALAVQRAEAAGNQTAADGLRQQIVNLTQVVNALVRQKREQENPHPFGIALASDERLLQAQRDVRQAARDVAQARGKGAAAEQTARRAFTQAAGTYSDAVEQAKNRETPSDFSLGLAGLTKLLPWLALGAAAVIVVPPLLARRGGGERKAA